MQRVASTNRGFTQCSLKPETLKRPQSATGTSFFPQKVGVDFFLLFIVFILIPEPDASHEISHWCLPGDRWRGNEEEQ